MAIYLLGDDPTFPDPELAEKNGILAIGGDLSVKRLLNAYCNGIFPWYSSGEPILWWSPDPRMVLFPEELHIPRSMKKLLNKNPFKITCNQNFELVIKNCQKQHREGNQTWITNDMASAYIGLHQAGYAHSIEANFKKKIVGGLYGLALGKCFFGESMFYLMNNASKFAFIKFVQMAKEMGILIIDCQMKTEHLKRFGAREIPRKDFLGILKKGLQETSLKWQWNSQLLGIP